MSEIAIRVENLSKQYRIGQREVYKTLRDTLTDAFYAPFRLLFNSKPETRNPKPNYIWALKDVSFEIKRGEVVGIIGRNGAGKSTLLKVLSRITEPTKGMAEIHGRLGSLLEVGTGFHPELTGRENIYLNGAILGMKRAEIERKFDEMVAFAEVEKFLDMPVKRYSSGMYVRLAFAVAAHLESEILLVDEVLAVGDAAFQKKCLGKIDQVASEGRTVLFVSHNMTSVASLCRRCILLDKGTIEMDDIAHNTVSKYLSSISGFVTPTDGTISLSDHPGRIKKQEGLVRLTRCKLLDRNLQPVNNFTSGDEVRIAIGYQMRSPVKNASVEFIVQVNDSYDRRLFTCFKDISKDKLLADGIVGEVQCIIPKLPLIPSNYSLTLGVNVGGIPSDSVYGAVRFDVMPGSWFGNSRQPIDSWGNCLTESYWIKSNA